MKQLQHYVPQFLLREFSGKALRKHRKVGSVWVRDLSEDRVYCSTVRKVAAESGFYRASEALDPDSLEQWLAKIEGHAAPAVTKLTSSFDWRDHTHDDRMALSVFLATLYSRGPRVRRNLREMPIQILNHFEARADSVAPELRAQLEEASQSDPIPIHEAVIHDVSHVSTELALRTWSLLRAPIGSRYSCCDSPVLMANPIEREGRGNMGLLAEGVILYLPLSPHLLLMVSDPIHGLRDRGTREIGAQEFRNVQWMTGFYAERFLYAREPEDLVVPDGSWVGGRRATIVSPPLPAPYGPKED